MVIMLIPITLITAIPVWQWPNFETWLYLWGIAILGTLAHFAWTKSYAMTEITSLEPIGFIKLPIIALLGWMIFSEIPGTWTWVGGFIIFMSTIYISHRETKAANSLKPNIGPNEPKL
jgi:drug/metabolite transporter (DMT)-like permease